MSLHHDDHLRFKELLDALDCGDRDRAIDIACMLLGRGHDHAVTFYLAAERLEKEGQWGQALELLEKAAAKEPNDAEPWRRIGEVLVRQGMMDDAIEAFELALEIDPAHYPTLIAAGATNYQLGHLASAESCYRRAASLMPDEDELISTLALVVARNGKSEEARELAERALSLSPSSIAAELALGRADLLEGFADRVECRTTRTH